MRRGYVDGPWGQVHYRTAGDDGPALVVLHESPLSSAIFEPTVAVLGRSMRVWALDTPGYGMSDPPPGRPTIGDYARLVGIAVDALGIDRFAVLGSHTGASIALELVEFLDEGRVTHVVLTGIPLFADAEREWYRQADASPLEPARDGSHLLWAWHRYLRRVDPGSAGGVAATEPLPERLGLALVNELAGHIITNPDRYAWGYDAAFAHDIRPLLERLRLATLLLNAEFDTLAAADDEAESIVSDVTRVTLTGIAARPYWLVPELYAMHIRNFLGVGCLADGEIN